MSEFDKYIVQGEPDKKAKANAWQTAIVPSCFFVAL